MSRVRGEDGALDGVQVAVRAAQAGISPGRVQHYFPAKQGLIEAAFERGNELSAARIAARLGDDPAPRLVLTTVLTELIPYDAMTSAHMRVRQSFHALGLADEAIAARLRVLYADLHRRLADLIRSEDVRGNAEEAALDLVALAEGLAAYVLIGVTPAAVARDRVLAAIDGLIRR